MTRVTVGEVTLEVGQVWYRHFAKYSEKWLRRDISAERLTWQDYDDPYDIFIAHTPDSISLAIANGELSGPILSPIERLLKLV